MGINIYTSNACTVLRQLLMPLTHTTTTAPTHKQDDLLWMVSSQQICTTTLYYLMMTWQLSLVLELEKRGNTMVLRYLAAAAIGAGRWMVGINNEILVAYGMCPPCKLMEYPQYQLDPCSGTLPTSWEGDCCWKSWGPDIDFFCWGVFFPLLTRWGMLYVTILKSYISYFGKFSRYMNSWVSGPTTYSHF